MTCYTNDKLNIKMMIAPLLFNWSETFLEFGKGYRFETKLWVNRTNPLTAPPHLHVIPMTMNKGTPQIIETFWQISQNITH